MTGVRRLPRAPAISFGNSDSFVQRQQAAARDFISAGNRYTTTDECAHVRGLGTWTSLGMSTLPLLENYLVSLDARPGDTWGDVDPVAVRRVVVARIALEKIRLEARQLAGK